MHDAIADAFARHQRIGFQFSGGRDSTAALFVLRPYWDRITTIYYVDTGDMWPETRRVIEQTQALVGRKFVRIQTDVVRYRREVGLPSDVVPSRATPLGRAVYGGSLSVVNRFDCCWVNIMRPMHLRMLDDGITLIVRGTRREDYATMPAKTGDTDGRTELLLPVEDWSTQQVDDYIAANNLPKSPMYAAGAGHGSDCMHCTAWWDDGRLPYLREHYPRIFEEVDGQMSVIRAAIDAELATGFKER